MQKRILKRAAAFVTAFALTVSGSAVANVQAATKAPVLSASKLSLKKGETKKVTVNKAKTVTVKKVTWSLSGKKVIKISKAAKTYAKIKALAKGSASVTAKIKTKTKTYKRTVKVTVTASATKKPAVTKKPAATKTPTADTSADTSTVPAATGDTSTVPAATNTSDSSQTGGNAGADISPVTDGTSVPPAQTTEAKATATPTTKPSPTATPTRVYVTPTPNVIKMLSQSSWHKGIIMNLDSAYAGCKVKITMQVKEVGNDEPTGTVDIKSNYNSYPTLASVNLSTEWQPVEIEYRFNEFTNSSPVLYFDNPYGSDGKQKEYVTSDMTMCVKDLTFEVVDLPDLLGGTVLSSSSWHYGIIGSLKGHDNEEVTISFKIREKGVENPDGKLILKSNYIKSNPVMNSDYEIPITTDWTEVSFNYEIGTITDSSPSLYIGTESKSYGLTDDMEFYVTDFKVEKVRDITPEAGGSTGETNNSTSEASDKTLTLTGYSALTSGAGGFKFADGTGYPADFDISNYKSVTVNFKIYDSDGNVMKDGTQVTNYGKLALNDSQDTTKYCGEYSAGYGDGLALMYFNNVGRYGNEITDDGITSKTFDLSEETASADCISAALGGNVAKFEIVSIVLTKKPAEDVTDATLTGYSALTSGAGGFKFADGTGYPENFDITNYKSVTVNFKIYDSDGNVMKDGTQVTNYGKLALNDSQNTTKYCGDYSAGYGDGFALMYFNNVGRYGNAITEDGITSKTFNLSEDTATADCISAALGGNVAKFEIVSIVLSV